MAVSPADKGHSPFPSSERAIYGFALYLGSYLLLAVFLLWAFLPDEWLNFIGFTYFPQKYWAVAVPAYLLVGFVVFLLVYSGMNFLLVPDLDDPRNIRDSHSLPPPSSPPQTSVAPLYDIPISEVNKVMFDTRHCPRAGQSKKDTQLHMHQTR